MQVMSFPIVKDIYGLDSGRKNNGFFERSPT